LYLYAAVSPATGTFYRAVFGLPLLVLVAFWEWQRHGPLPRRSLAIAALAGVAFTGDLMFWHNAIESVGAGLATVLGNLQVIIVGFFAWLRLGERPSRATLRPKKDHAGQGIGRCPASAAAGASVAAGASAARAWVPIAVNTAVR